MMRKFLDRNTKRAFTLIELLVVIAIIAILAAILFPVFARAKESARISQGVSNTKQMLTAFMLYMGDNNDVLPLGNPISRLMDSREIGHSEWQNAIYPYVKSEGVYKLPSDPTKAPRVIPTCPTSVSLKTKEYSASSFLTNFNITDPVRNPDGSQGRQSPPATAVTAPAQFILLMNGQRPIIAGAGSGLRYDANPPDHNGDRCSAWMGIYSQPTDGGANHLTNPGRLADGGTVPHHKSGLLFGFMDGHAKFIPLDTERRPDLQLEGKMPWCRYGKREADAPGCTQRWNIEDAF